ncbi:4-hydroxy-tetrahydrodipicolinate reductase [Cytophaga hutchinsonii]|jgi:4-hydroxy-tetrahydrodipicolinate reductase|uniref:4-hydroxy-tetrahydrodipicolinate reductase n=1 Tax=Cytophaga hutchinsonii (strain ATCC 33406 / DSM 1761 / CIP 103989 / NBRC 15051 / NCIMB 9469 / D465) TaxID=269798 RepID=A0A6N4STR0_CYTH3|nr:4-hydroxy-tetrahydrodipicolinate reductase [Cytophaga hutchinsonii]ABG59816.1 dihydrodipicolinate reductase [Cytophaga hutchinsonii ATCC 33406]SFX29336.1 dihydrodipicolinate reductase [Cytophaga hutchinsonii ATCC 33406]
MRIALIGYGKMGKTIERIAIERGHTISAIIDVHNKEDIKNLNGSMADVAIEFSQPESAFLNISHCLENNLPIVSGTTGWLKKKPVLDEICRQNNGSFFYASNYSIGVNIFFHLNKILAGLMKKFPDYAVSMEEIHHTEKKDAPSGTAITLAEGLMSQNSAKTKWVNEASENDDELEIISKRIDDVPGTHTVFYNSPIDTIEIKHTAHSREGFAQGAVMAAEWTAKNRGVFGMNDLLKIS